MEEKDFESSPIPVSSLTSFREDYIRRVAEAYMRRSVALEPSILRVENHPSSSRVSIPPFLQRLISSPFGDSVKELNRDVIAKADYHLQGQITKDIGEAVQSLVKFNLATIDSPDTTQLEKSRSALTIREIQKAQLLISCPKLHTPLSLGGHFKYEDVPQSFRDIDWSWVPEAGRLYKKLTRAERKYTYTLPLATSQGLLLKGERENLQTRAFSKALLSSIALDLQTMPRYLAWIEQVDKIFHRHGYHSVASSFYLGIRRQQARKPEVVTDPKTGDVLGQSVAYQGRIRGIFPAPEQIKIILKPISEGLKKSLFEGTECCSVNMVKIAQSLWTIAAKSLEEGLFIEEKEDLHGERTVKKWLSFYDLGQFDTTQHFGFFEKLYMPFLDSCFDDFQNTEFPMTYPCDFLFPSSTKGFDVIRQEVNARSTMSGQPDVTVKNNVVHMLSMTHAISKILKRPPLEVFSDLIQGKNGMIAKVHGDDTMLYFSSNPQDYLDYKSEMENLGLIIDFEMGPVYLKKTIPWSSCVNIDTFKRNYNEIQKMDPADQSLNEKLLYGADKKLAPVVGSIVKNRHGEYPIPHTLLLKMSVVDTILLLEGEPEWDLCLKELWRSLWNITGKTSDVLQTLDADIFDGATSSQNFAVARRMIVDQVLELTASNSDLAKSARDYLERIFYSNLQDGSFGDDAEMVAIYGALEYDPVSEAESFGLQSLSFEKKNQLFEKIQNELITSDGQWPSLDDVMFMKKQILES